MRITPVLLTTWLLAVASCGTPPGLHTKIDSLPLVCGGKYRSHLQGIATDGTSIYWGFTFDVVKTDLHGEVLRRIEVPGHHGDLCCVAGLVYVAVNFGAFNEPAGKADSWVYVYSGRDLSLLRKHRVPELVHGAGGIAHRDGHFFVVGGLPKASTKNLIYEYDAEFRFLLRHEIPGYTLMGIQTATFHDDKFWFGCYGEPQTILRCSADLGSVTVTEVDGSMGLLVSGKEFLVGRWDSKMGAGSIELLGVVGARLQCFEAREPETPPKDIQADLPVG